MERHTPRASVDSIDRSRRYPTPHELDQLWTWVCGSRIGGGYVRGDPAAIAKALGISAKALDRLMAGRSSFQVSTIRRVLARIDALLAAEAEAAPRLAKLAWSAEDGTARDARGRYYARYLAGDAWAYLTGCGDGYATAMEARHAAAKMNALQRASPEAFGASTGAV